MLKTEPIDRPSSKEVAEELALLASQTFTAEERAPIAASNSSR
jgi:hypothetical protein